jgi:hypothetical protein
MALIQFPKRWITLKDARPPCRECSGPEPSCPSRRRSDISSIENFRLQAAVVQTFHGSFWTASMTFNYTWWFYYKGDDSTIKWNMGANEKAKKLITKYGSRKTI